MQCPSQARNQLWHGGASCQLSQRASNGLEDTAQFKLEVDDAGIRCFTF